NSCLLHSYYANVWKMYLITPLPKISQPTDFKHLRPINILPTMSKILEKIMYRQLIAYLDANKILPITQSGFRVNHSCTTALLNIVDDILMAADQNHLTALILLDYTKAFDCINHSLLLAILHYIGLGKGAECLIKSFITDRKQKVM